MNHTQNTVEIKASASPVGNNAPGFWQNIIFIYIGICVLWHGLMVIVPFIHLVSPTPLNRLSDFLWAAGILIMAADLVLTRRIRRAPGILLLYALLVVAAVSSFFQRKYGVFANVKTISWMLNIFFLFYTAPFRAGKAYLGRFLKGLYYTIFIIWSCSCVLSLYQFVFQIGAEGPRYAPSPIFNSMGFYKNRLFGLFGYPEYGAVVGLVLILAGGYYIVTSRYLAVKVLLVLMDLPIFWYIVLSVSRNAAVAMFLAVFIGAVLVFRGHLPDRIAGAGARRVLVSFLLALLVVGGLFAAYRSTVLVAVKIPPAFAKTSKKDAFAQPLPGQETGRDEGYLYKAYAAGPVKSLAESGRNLLLTGIRDLPDTKKSAEDENEESILSRQDSKKDISTGRFEIWRDYISLRKEIGLFGLSPENSSWYIQEHNPDLFIARSIRLNYPKRYEAGYVFHPHNGYLKVFASTGLIGVAILLAFIGVCLARIFSYLKTHQKVSPAFLFSLLMVVAGASSAMFDLEIFFVIKPMTFIFWLSLGILMRNSGQRE